MECSKTLDIIMVPVWTVSIFQMGMISNGLTIAVISSSKKMKARSVNKLILNQSAIDLTAATFMLATCYNR